MEHGRLVMALLTVIAVVNWAGVAAQSDCSNVLISLAPCINYITGNSSTPSSGCCTQLATVVRSQPQCLCQVLNGGGSSLGININQTLALALPRECNVQTPSVSSCNGKHACVKFLDTTEIFQLLLQLNLQQVLQDLPTKFLQDPGLGLFHQQTTTQVEAPSSCQNL